MELAVAVLVSAPDSSIVRLT